MDPTQNESRNANWSDAFFGNAQNLLQGGQQAMNLLQSPIFNMAVEYAKHSILMEIAQTEPKEEKKRESLYMTLRGMQTAVSGLAEFVEAARLEAQRQEEQRDPDRRAAEERDWQGFGGPPTE